MKRSKITYLLLIITTIIIGLASRYYAEYLPDFINLGLGDALWALMMYWMIGFIFPRISPVKLTILSLCICFLVEFSQLLQADWIIAIRNNTFGALILGKGFLWSDLIAYTLGVGTGMTIEKYLLLARVSSR
ncbi:ribosomal maturation YjgA family protein [Carboxylicivirga marina]|uniref:DUF2809 domain-containing protein n=1 Tax=Carboxylicivirga marina TaxID=2800988 RepID=A0ABS1HE50_9BACT|nr:DUF2809 domain-containing protein [Carboxylicivirga marina]MBK3515892.1 DUF2809 domain-containing protein [Carboxylicivirga marina]